MEWKVLTVDEKWIRLLRNILKTTQQNLSIRNLVSPPLTEKLRNQNYFLHCQVTLSQPWSPVANWSSLLCLSQPQSQKNTFGSPVPLRRKNSAVSRQKKTSNPIPFAPCWRRSSKGHGWLVTLGRSLDNRLLTLSPDLGMCTPLTIPLPGDTSKMLPWENNVLLRPGLYTRLNELLYKLLRFCQTSSEIYSSAVTQDKLCIYVSLLIKPFHLSLPSVYRDGLQISLQGTPKAANQQLVSQPGDQKTGLGKEASVRKMSRGASSLYVHVNNVQVYTTPRMGKRCEPL